MKKNKIIIPLLFCFLSLFLFTCKKQDVQVTNEDQPISVSITVDEKTSVETRVR